MMALRRRALAGAGMITNTRWPVKTVAQLGVVVTLATELAVANTNGQL